MKTVVIDQQLYLTPSWQEMGNLCFQLSQKILQKNQHFDRLVALVKGGLTWSRTLLDYLNIKKLSAFQVEFYQTIGKTRSQPIIIQSLPVVVQDEIILLFDDVVDSGQTLKMAKDYLYMCGAKKVVSASVYIKDWAKLKPDFYAAKTNAWIIFPHEINETITLLFQKWQKKGLDYSQIKKRLLTLGLPKNQVNYFLPKK